MFRYRKIGMVPLVLVIVFSAVLGIIHQPQHTTATTSWVYCASIPKYACTRFIYSASGNNWTMLERNWKGSRGCAWDQFGQWTCGAEKWRMLAGWDRYVPAGAGYWANGYSFGPYGWEYNDTLPAYWRVSAPDKYYWADTIGTYQYFEFFEQGQYWYLSVYAYA